MTLAILEELTEGRSFVCRVFDDGQRYGDKYKFHTVITIVGGIAEIKGLSNAAINTADLRAMFVSIRAEGAKYATWTHRGKTILKKL